ncbi:hypothetical protein HDU86_000699 [Geranomyces michiganensis]|nr:hypothetical protein HDU86_000699 [Geranomyces michiganensis]
MSTTDDMIPQLKDTIHQQNDTIRQFKDTIRQQNDTIRQLNDMVRQLDRRLESLEAENIRLKSAIGAEIQKAVDRLKGISDIRAENRKQRLQMVKVVNLGNLPNTIDKYRSLTPAVSGMTAHFVMEYYPCDLRQKIADVLLIERVWR